MKSKSLSLIAISILILVMTLLVVSCDEVGSLYNPSDKDKETSVPAESKSQPTTSKSQSTQSTTEQSFRLLELRALPVWEKIPLRGVLTGAIQGPGLTVPA